MAELWSTSCRPLSNFILLTTSHQTQRLVLLASSSPTTGLGYSPVGYCNTSIAPCSGTRIARMLTPSIGFAKFSKPREVGNVEHQASTYLQLSAATLPYSVYFFIVGGSSRNLSFPFVAPNSSVIFQLGLSRIGTSLAFAAVNRKTSNVVSFGGCA